MKNERDIEGYVKWVLELEAKFPVEQWMIDGVRVWPLLRTRLNFHFFTSQQKQAQPAEPKNPGTVAPVKRYISLSSLLENSWALFKFILTPLKKTPVIGADFVAHRSLFEGKLVDKYFDPIFDSIEDQHNGLIVEYQRTDGLDRNTLYKPDRIIKFYEFRELLHILGSIAARLATPKYELKDYDAFIKIIESEGVNTTLYLKENVRRTLASIRAFKWFWKKLFKKTSAKTVIGLCYYTEPLYAMNLAAREAGVTSVDLQHGGQGRQHLSYAQFTRLPSSGSYELMPHYFWCWDDSSAGIIQEWITQLNSTHRVIQMGHPWLQYIRARKWPELDGVKDIVLITLQLYDISELKDPIDDYIAATIKLTAKELNWYVRLHPRMSHLRGALNEQLRRLGVADSVNVDAANDLPMPAILSRASVHLTKSSGSAIEAALLGVPNVILDEHGASRYDEYIRQGQASLYLGTDPGELANVIRKAIAGKINTSADLKRNWDFLLRLQ